MSFEHKFVLIFEFIFIYSNSTDRSTTNYLQLVQPARHVKPSSGKGSTPITGRRVKLLPFAARGDYVFIPFNLYAFIYVFILNKYKISVFISIYILFILFDEYT